MQNSIRNTNLRFNLDKEQQRKAWEYLQTMNRQDFKSYSQVISLALVDYFDRYYRTQADPYLETREREELFATLRKYEYNPDLMHLYVVGGGGCLIRNFGTYDQSRVTIIDDICATAKGYESLAYMSLKRRG